MSYFYGEGVWMTLFPNYLRTYPNMLSNLPLHLSVNRLKRGYPAHKHNFLEFSLCIDGSGYEIINGVKHELVPGTFSFVLPYQIHELFTTSGEILTLYNCNFGIELLLEERKPGNLNGFFTTMDSLPSFLEFNKEQMDVIRKILDEMHEEYQGDQVWRNTMLIAKFKEIIVRFDRYSKQIMTASHEQALNVNHSPIISRMIHYIHCNYQEDITLTTLSQQFALSASRISELIKQTTGQSFVHFMNDLRVRHAAGLLVSTDLNMTEIAHEVGYSSYKTFSRVFREYRGTLPTHYRKKIRQDE
jgi:AraC-like DNA-binding protein